MRRILVWGVMVLIAACGAEDLSNTSTTAAATTSTISTRASTEEKPSPEDAEQGTTTTSVGAPPVGTATTVVTGESIADPVGTATENGEEESATAGSDIPSESREDLPVPESETDAQPLIEGLGARTAAQIRETASVVEEIRGLKFDGLPSITVLTPEAFAERVRMETAEQLETVEVDEALYKLLGLLAPDDDLAALYGELYGEGVAGFYSSERREMVLPRAGEEFSQLETLTLFHELVHAVTDQHFGFGSQVDTLIDAQRFDRASSLVSVVEGDATLSEVLYVQSLDSAERARLMSDFAQMEEPDFAVPRFMEQALYFPYEQGFEFVFNAWGAGGWPAVNDLYADPPLSTEEIFEGVVASGARPFEMERPQAAWPGGYEEFYDYTWGFLDILLMFEQVLGPDAAVDAATGWGAGRSLVAYHADGEVAFLWEYAGDSPEEAEELALLLYDYATEGMDVGTPVRAEGDHSFEARAGDYVFVSLIPEGLVMVACSDPTVCPMISAPYRS